MPIHHVVHDYRFPRPDGRATLTTMPGSDVPVIRQPWEPGDMLPFWGMGAAVDDHHLYGWDDAGETENLVGSAHERDAIELLRHALDTVEAPAHQYERLGLGTR